MGVTERLARFVVETGYEDIPPEAIEVAQRISLDCLGTTLAGFGDSVGGIITKVVRESGGSSEATVIGAGFKSSPTQAALANGTMAHALDYDDMGLSMGHPSVPVLPVILALGEKLHLTGREILTAHVIAFEVQGKLGYGSHQLYSTGWHSTGVFGVMGATAAASKLLKLDVDQTRMAFGIAASHAAAAKPNMGSMTKPLHAGNAARGGLMSALLAKEGFTADPNIIEHPLGYAFAFIREGRYDLDKMVSSLADPWHIVEPGVTLKKYPCCGGNHAPLDALFKMMDQHSFGHEDVESVQVECDEAVGLMLSFEEPENGYQGKFCLQYNIAAALVDGKVTKGTFVDEKVRDPRIKDAMKRVNKVVHWDWKREFGTWSSPVTVTLKSGERFQEPGNFIKGSPHMPLSVEEIVEKYRDNASGIIAEPEVNGSIDMMLDLRNLRDVSELMATVSGNSFR